jgi:hypothetical protein
MQFSVINSILQKHETFYPSFPDRGSRRCHVVLQGARRAPAFWNVDGFVEPVFQPPETAFGLAIKDALKAFLDSENYQREPSIWDSDATCLFEGIDGIDTFNLLYNECRLTDWLFYATLFYNAGETDNVFGESEQQTVVFKNRFLYKNSWGMQS